MPKTSFLRNYSKTSKTPRHPFEKERIDGELKLVGEYGLRNKRELWRTQLALAKIRKSARALLTLEPKDPKRMFEAPALLRRLQRYGLVEDSEMDLDSVLQMTTQRLLERRLQTKVFKQGLAKSIHHARVLIKQRHIRVGKQVVNALFHGATTREARRLRGDVALRPGPAGPRRAQAGRGQEPRPAAAAAAARSRTRSYVGRVICNFIFRPLWTLAALTHASARVRA